MSADRIKPVSAFYIIGGLRELIPIYPLYAIMFGEHGVSPFDLSLLFVIWAAVGLLTEVPSGAWADRYSRKWLVIYGSLLKAAAFLAWFAWPAFWGYALGFVLWGLGSSLRSGAFEALLHDQLKAWDETAKFTFHYGRIRALATLSIILGELAGGVLIVHGYNAVLLVSMVVPILVTVPFALWVQEPAKDESVAEPAYLDHLRAGVSEVVSNPAIRFIFFSTTFLLIAFGVYDEYEPPLLFEKGFSPSMVAFLAVPIYLAQSLGELLAHRFTDLSFRQLLWVMVFGSLFLVPVPWLDGYLVPMVIACFTLFLALASTVYAGQLQARIEGASRATVTSMIGFGDSLGAIIWFLIFGVVAEFSNLSVATMVFGLLTIILCLAARRLLVMWQIRG